MRADHKYLPATRLSEERRTVVSFKQYIVGESQARQAARASEARKLLHEDAGAARTIGSITIDAAKVSTHFTNSPFLINPESRRIRRSLCVRD
jgi:hypothetical protein